MFQEYNPVFSALTDYLVSFEKNGYNKACVGNITALFPGIDGTPLGDLMRGREDAVRFTIVLGALVNFSRRAAEIVHRVFGAPAGSITPEAVCELFFGVTDIFPLVGWLSENSSLGLFFEGAEPRFNAVMKLKPFVARFTADGDIDDDAFVYENYYDTNYIELSENVRAENEIKAAICTKVIDPVRIIAVTGEEGSGRRTAAERALGVAGCEYVGLRCDLHYDRRKIDELATKLLLLDALPIAVQGENTDTEVFVRFADTLAENVGTVVAICRENIADLTSAETISVNIGLPAIKEQYRIWENEIRFYKTDDTVDISELASEFSFTVGGIKKALRFAKTFSENDILSSADIKNGCCRSINPDPGSKAVKINRVFGWDDLILSAHYKNLMKSACDQVRYRHKVYDTWGFSEKIAYGKSVSMLFTGPPGTGKTMAAQIIAAELGLDIYRVSLANVVSKYIGETEKNLDEIFEKARKSKVVLFFDEADVLFSKRTEVKDSNDKYSNMESAFLLQKIEEYDGIVILATNLVQNFDEAFKRRMKMLISFTLPDEERRREMWIRAFPEKLPLDNIDFAYLVRNFELSGSSIKNIALHSAFLAAGEGSEAVGMRHIIAALKNEYSKSGKAFTKAEAGEYFYYIDE